MLMSTGLRIYSIAAYSDFLTQTWKTKTVFYDFAKTQHCKRHLYKYACDTAPTHTHTHSESHRRVHDHMFTKEKMVSAETLSASDQQVALWHQLWAAVAVAQGTKESRLVCVYDIP